VPEPLPDSVTIPDDPISRRPPQRPRDRALQIGRGQPHGLQHHLDDRDVNRIAVVRRCGDCQLYGPEKGAFRLGGRSLEWLGGGPEEERTVDIAGPRDEIAITAYDCNRAFVSRLDNPRPSLRGQQNSTRDRRFALLRSISSDDLLLELVDDGVQLPPLLGHAGFDLAQAGDRLVYL